MCATQLPTADFISMVLDRFQISDWLSLTNNGDKHGLRTPGGRRSKIPKRLYRDQEQEVKKRVSMEEKQPLTLVLHFSSKWLNLA